MQFKVTQFLVLRALPFTANPLKVSFRLPTSEPSHRRSDSPQATGSESIFRPVSLIGNILAAELDRLGPVTGTAAGFFLLAEAEQRCKGRSKKIKAISIKEGAPGGLSTGGEGGGELFVSVWLKIC